MKKLSLILLALALCAMSLAGCTGGNVTDRNDGIIDDSTQGASTPATPSAATRPTQPAVTVPRETGDSVLPSVDMTGPDMQTTESTGANR